MVAKNIAYLWTIQLLRLCLPLALLSVLTSVLTGMQYSVYVYTLASAGWLSIFVEYGFNVSATRRIAAAEELTSTQCIVLETQSAKLSLAMMSVAFLVWALTLSHLFLAYREWALSAWLLGVLTGMTPTYYYQGTSNLRIVALLEVIGGLLIFFSTLVFVQGPEHFWRLCITLVVVRFVCWYILDRRMFSEVRLRYWSGMTTSRGYAALKDGWRLFLVQAAASLYTSFNVVLLGGVSTAQAVAVYGSAERLIRAGLSFISQATSAIFPRLTALRATDSARLRKSRALSLSIFAAAGFCSLPIIYSVAPSISQFLFNDKLPDLASILSTMALVIPAIAISNVLGFHFLVVDHQEAVLNWVVFAGVPISLVAGYLLSQKYGALGMTIAWVGVEWIIAAVLALYIHLRRQRSPRIHGLPE